MAKKTNCTINGRDYFRIYRKVGKKLNKAGLWVDEYKNFYGSCKSEAEAAYNDYMSKRQSGSLNKCLGQIIDEWAEAVFFSSSLADSTKLRYFSAYERLFRNSQLAGRQPGDVTALDLQKYYNDLDAPASSKKALHNLLRRFYRYAQLNGICQDITGCIEAPQRSQTVAQDALNNDIDVWPDEEVKKVIEALKGSTLRLLIVLAVNTGARFSELLALTYDDVKDNALTIKTQLSDAPKRPGDSRKLHINDTKTPASRRVIPLSAQVMEEIAEHKRLHKAEMLKNGYRSNNLFTSSTGNYLYRRNVARSLERLYKRIGVQYHSFHAYRHTFGTNLSRAGVPIEETARLMGHSSINVTAKYYINVSAERKRQAVEKITRYSL